MTRALWESGSGSIGCWCNKIEWRCRHGAVSHRGVASCHGRRADGRAKAEVRGVRGEVRGRVMPALRLFESVAFGVHFIQDAHGQQIAPDGGCVRGDDAEGYGTYDDGESHEEAE